MARLLLAEGGRVVGTVAPQSASYHRNACYLSGVEIHEVDLRDRARMSALIADVAPQEVYNLAALSSVSRSWAEPEIARAVNGTAASDLVEICARVDARLLQAGSAEEGLANPYAQAKEGATASVATARARGAYACVAHLYPHESPLRPATFVTGKISRSFAEISAGQRERLKLGNLEVTRDWGSAADAVRAMRMMLLQDEPSDHEVATGIGHTLRDLIVVAGTTAGLHDPMSYVEIDPDLTRPVDAAILVGDPSALTAATGWVPTESFEDVIAGMVMTDTQRLETGVESDPNYLKPMLRRPPGRARRS